MKARFAAALAAFTIILTAVLAGCGGAPDGGRTPGEAGGEKLTIVCATFPAYDWTMRVLGDRAEGFDVVYLMASGVDLHNFQPSVASAIRFSVGAGDLLCVIGENGTGKSTFVKTLLGILPPVAGRVEFGEGTATGSAGSAPGGAGASGGADAAWAGTSAHTYTDAEVDYDLTAMGADMVYATVLNIMTDPTAFAGKIIRMAGPYTRSVLDTGTYYFVIIRDATACCAQGLEFVWDDGSHTFPDDYPPLEAEVMVTGVFMPYLENDLMYAHLIDASLTLA